MNATARTYAPPFAPGLVRRALLGTLLALGVTAAMATPATATASTAYTFTKMADSVQHGFGPFSLGCSSINARGDIAFRGGRAAPDGFNTIDGIYRVNAADGSITTIAETGKRFETLGRNPSMNDSGQVSFAARLGFDRKTGDALEAIIRSSGKKLTTIARTKGDRYNFFGFDTSISDAGEVAFKAELDEEFGFEEGMFSGSGGGITTHYLASTSQFDGNDSRPSINDLGEIAFRESIDFDDGVFVTDGSGFTTISAPDPDRSVSDPTLNDAGTAAFELSFFDGDQQVFSIVTGNGGELTTVADTRGDYGSFGFRPPSINEAGEVAFSASLDDFVTSGIFVGPDPVADRVIATGDTLDGATVTGITFCEEGLSDSGALSLTAFFEDPQTFELRSAVFRATPAG